MMATKDIPEEILKAEENAFLEPAVSQIAVPVIPIPIQNGAKQEIELNDGTKLYIPNKAFVDEDGYAPSREIELQVRQFNDPLAMIAAGIPGHTLEGEEPRQLESMGLIEVRATYRGKPMKLREGAAIRVEMPIRTQAQREKGALFQLDPESRSWVASDAQYAMEEASIPESEMATYINDGFGAVEFHADGSAVERDPADTVRQAPRRPLVHSFELTTLGYAGSFKALPGKALERVKVRFKDTDGNRLQLYGLYKITASVNAVTYFWPKDNLFTFELSLMPGTGQTVFGLTEDGKLAHVGGEALDALQADADEIEVVEMKVSETPVKNIEDLKQRLGLSPNP